MGSVISTISTFAHSVLSHVLALSNVNDVPISATKDRHNSSERLFRGAGPVEPLRDGAVVSVSQTSSSVQPVSSKVSDAVRKRFRRALRDVVYLLKGSSQDVYPLQSWYFPEALDPLHRYGKQLRSYYEIWRKSRALHSFNMWMCQLEVGQNIPGKEELS